MTCLYLVALRWSEKFVPVARLSPPYRAPALTRKQRPSSSRECKAFYSPFEAIAGGYSLLRFLGRMLNSSEKRVSEPSRSLHRADSRVKEFLRNDH